MPSTSGKRSAVKKAGTAAAAAVVGKRKKLSFSEATVKAAAASIHTTNVAAPLAAGRTPVPRADTKGKRPAVSKSKGSAIVKANKAKGASRTADLKRRGIVRATRAPENNKKNAARASSKKRHRESDGEEEVEEEEDTSDDEKDMLHMENGEFDGDDLSELADEEEALLLAGNSAAAPSRERNSAGEVTPYRVVRLSFLPSEFQEPQLYKFLNQFGATVVNCFCVRSKRTHRSRGVAYVEFDDESIIPLVVEECHGMALGGMSVRARAVTMRRPMPTRKLVTRRRALAYAHRTKGTPLKQHDVRGKAAEALLIKAARTEKANNTYLQSLGINFSTDFFKSQLAAVPASRRKQRRRGVAKANSAQYRHSSSHSAVAKKAPRAAAKGRVRSSP